MIRNELFVQVQSEKRLNQCCLLQLFEPGEGIPCSNPNQGAKLLAMRDSGQGAQGYKGLNPNLDTRALAGTLAIQARFEDTPVAQPYVVTFTAYLVGDGSTDVLSLPHGETHRERSPTATLTLIQGSTAAAARVKYSCLSKRAFLVCWTLGYKWIGLRPGLDFDVLTGVPAWV